MPADISLIRPAMAAALEAGVDSIQHVSAYSITPHPPCIHVHGLEEVGYHKAMVNGHDSWIIQVRSFAGVTSDIEAQKILDRLIKSTGPDSVLLALEADRTLGGLVQDLSVMDCSGYRMYVVEGQAPLLGAEWRVTVMA